MIDLSLSEKWKELEEYISKNKIDSNIPKVKIDSFVKIGRFRKSKIDNNCRI